MKNLFTLFLLLPLSVALLAQPIRAYDDNVNFDTGETITINPLLNDYSSEGYDLIIDSVYSPVGCEILSYNDSTITFKMDDYVIHNDNSNFNPKFIYQLEFDLVPITARVNLYPAFTHIDTLEINQISAPIYPLNLQFFDRIAGSSLSYFRYPKDSTSSTLFSSSLWIGGKSINDELHLAAERYRDIGADFWPGPLSANGSASTDSLNAGNWLRTWKVSREMINTHIASFNDPEYIIPEAILNWPAHGNPDMNQDEFIAPFVDIDQDLEYRPELGDYPFIKGDETVFFVFNDQKFHSETHGQSLGVEIHCMAWAMEDVRDNNPYNSTIFYSYKIINRSTMDYFDTYLGVFTDLDLGYAWDDYIGCHVENGNFYVYNGTEIDGNGEPESYGERIPSQSVCILGGPFMDPDNMDNPMGQCNESINGVGFGDGEIDNERYGMNRFVVHNNSGPNPITDPVDAVDYYKFLNGIWKDDSPMCIGGAGHQDYGGDVNMPTRFMFAGDSDECNWGTSGIDHGISWSEENAENEPGDRRGLASMGPFTFEAGSVEYIDIAMITAPYSPDKESKELLQDYVGLIKQDYLENPMDFGFQYTGIEETNVEAKLLKVYPNPVNGDQIWFELEEQNESDYVIYNAAGQAMQSGKLEAQKQHQLNVGSLNSGWYLLEIRSANKTYRSKLIK